MKNNLYKMFTLVAYLSAVLLFSLLVSKPTLAQDSSNYLRIVRTIGADKTGLTDSAGVAFSTGANVFHVIEAHGNDYLNTNESAFQDISVFGNRLGSTPVKITVNNPINLTMDNKSGRLLIYQSTTHNILEINEDSKGNLDPNTLKNNDASSYGLQDPEGMTFDSIHSSLYFLDATGPELVRIQLQPQGNLKDVTVDAIALSWAKGKELRGIAYEQISGTLFVVSPAEQILYELSTDGDLIRTRDISAYKFSNSQAIFFAPSGDQTDDPKELSLYLIDHENQINSPTNQLSPTSYSSESGLGKIVELSMTRPSAPAVPSFISALVRTTITANFSPPSPDPSGLAYISSRNRLLISDSDVEETKQGITHFAGVNLWEVTLSGTVQRTANISYLPPTYVPMTNEPTGVAWNPGSGHYYFTDDNFRSVFTLDPGIDGSYGTGDDSWTSFLTDAQNGDPEGITYDPWNDHLFVVDGTNIEVYEYTLTGTLINHFDVEAFGSQDVESIEFNPVSGTLYILSNLDNHTVFETDTSGTLLQTIDISACFGVNPSGLAIAPASDNSGAQRFYITDRMVDNDFDPNENDGKMYEMTTPPPSTPANYPPVVNAGIDQTIAFGIDANLSGTATDDGNPILPGAVTTQWSVISGPGTVIFSNPDLLSTTASFSQTGTYEIRLTAYDGEFYSYDELVVQIISVAGSSLFEERLLASSDDAEESNSGVVDLLSPSLDMTFPSQKVGVRFLEIELPKNALINSAYIQFSAQKVNDFATLLAIYGEDQDNPGTFTASSQNVSTRLKTTAMAVWDPAPWTQLNQAGIDQRTSDLSEIVQELISRPGWSQGNSMVFLIEGTGIRSAWSYDGNNARAARLHIEYTISPNHVPVAVNDAYQVDEDSQLVVAAPGVLNNDTDADGDTLTAIKYTNPAHGTLTFNSNGSFVYTPLANYNGSDSFTYYDNDGSLNSNIATVNLTINPVNDPPVAVNDSYTTDEDVQLVIPAPGVLSNDTDIDGDALTVNTHTEPAHGVLTINPNGSFTYTPALNYFGPDSFTYRAYDSHVNSNIATVNLTISPVNDAPVAVNDSYSTDEDTQLAVPAPGVLGNDTDVEGETLTVSTHTEPAHGVLAINTNGSFTYTPAANYIGSDSFTYRAYDGHDNSNIATVSLTINAVNDPPVAVNDTYTTDEDVQLAIAAPGVLNNDTDVDGDTLVVIEHTDPAHGVLAINPNGSFTYTPELNYNGSDSFTYRANDGQLNSNIATVNITINPVNDAPVAMPDAYNVDEDTQLSIAAPGVLANDTDVDGDTLTVDENTDPAHGTLTINPDGSFVYTPNYRFYGMDSFSYRASDGNLTSDFVWVTISVRQTTFIMYMPLIMK